MISNNIEDFIGGEYGCLYVDPPWSYGNKSTRGAANDHYNTMTLEDIRALPVDKIAARDAHLHLWTTAGFIQEALQLIKDWKFEYRSQLIWVKPQMGMGNYWRVSHEILLLGIRGDSKRFNERNHKSWIELNRTKHSAKPIEIRSMVKAVSKGPYLEMFSREETSGWSAFGNEIVKLPKEKKEEIKITTTEKNSYEKGLDVERWSDGVITKYIKDQGFSIERIVPIGEDDYNSHGDYNIETPNKAYTMELKCENKISKCIFAEIWSNKSIGRKGWLYTCKADVLFYLFRDEGLLIKVKLPELQEYCLKNANKFREVEQKQHKQSNDTHGLLVPIDELRKHLKSFKEDYICVT